jgi:restriction system protein
MSRRSFGTSMRMIARAAAQADRAHQQSQSRQHSAHIRELRNAERQAKADVKETARLYLESRVEEAEESTREIQAREAAIDGVLSQALAQNPAINLRGTLKSFAALRFNDSQWTSSQPNTEHYMPLRPGFWARLVPGAAGRYGRRVADAKRRLETAEGIHERCCRDRATAFKTFEADELARRAEIEQHNATVNEMQRGLTAGEHAGVVGYYELVIGRSLEGEPDALSAEIGYSPDSKHLVVDLDLPEFSAVPEESGFRYVKSGDRIDAIDRPIAKRKAIYGLLLSKITLKCVDTVFRGGPIGAVETLTVNGMLDTIDPATGQQVRLCLLSVRVTADIFQTLNLAQVHPEHCLRSLKASVSRAPAELLPVKPLIELDMVDPRFVETLDVMSGLDHRPNLMELTPTKSFSFNSAAILCGPPGRPVLGQPAF